MLLVKLEYVAEALRGTGLTDKEISENFNMKSPQVLQGYMKRGGCYLQIDDTVGTIIRPQYTIDLSQRELDAITKRMNEEES